MYTTDWAQYRNITNDTYDGQPVVRPAWCKNYGYTPSHLDASLFTHIIYAFAKVEAGTYAVVDTETDDHALQAQLMAIKTKGVKTPSSPLVAGLSPQAQMCLLAPALSRSFLQWPALMPAEQPSYNRP